MKDPNRGKYNQLYMDEFIAASKVLGDYGGRIGWSTHDYQAFYFTGGGVSLIFYPHKTSAGHRHIRVRNQNSANAELADEIIGKLHIGAGIKSKAR